MEPETNDNTIDRDLLMSRVIDGEATSADWRAFRELAQRDASVWGELGEMQAHDDALSQAVRTVTDAALDVELPTYVDDEPLRSRFAVAGQWGGWLAAACMALVVFTGVRPGSSAPGVGGSQPQTAGVASSLGELLGKLSPDERFDAYVKAGKARGDVVYAPSEPAVLETRPTGSGELEVIVVRQIVERRRVQDVYASSVDDAGRTVVLPARVREVSGTSY